MIQVSATANVDHLEVVVSGEIEPQNVDRFRGRLRELVTHKTHFVTLDAAELTYIYSAGLGVLAELAHELIESGGKLQILNPGTRMRRLLCVTALDQIMTVVDGESSMHRHLTVSRLPL